MMTCLQCGKKERSAIAFNENVFVDGQTDIKMRVISVAFYIGGRVMYNLSWLHNGEIKEAWVDQERVRHEFDSRTDE